MAATTSPASAQAGHHPTGGAAGGVRRRLRRLVAASLPEIPAAQRGQPRVVTTAAWVVAAGAAAVAALVLRPPLPRPETLAVGAAVVFLLNFTSVKLMGSEVGWSTAGFVNLGLSYSVGPWGAVTAALAQAAGSGIRWRSPWSRSTFNAANIFLSNLAAAALYHAVAATGAGDWPLLLAGIAGGAVYLVVNAALLAVPLGLSGQMGPPIGYVRRTLSVLPYNLGYGGAGFGFVVLDRGAGTAGLVAAMIPFALLQGFLLVLAARTRRHEEERTRYLREREALLRRLLQASDEERRRIARDLHDGVVQSLTAISLGLSTEAGRLRGQRRLSARAQASAETMSEAAATTRAAMQELRTLIVEIAPPNLEPAALPSALRASVERLRAQGADCRFDVDASLELDQATMQLVFRVAQEALRNAAKYAGACLVTVRLCPQDGGGTLLEVRDAGPGFDDEVLRRRRSEGHVGLSLITDLAAEKGAELVIHSRIGEGTTIRLKIPVSE